MEVKLFSVGSMVVPAKNKQSTQTNLNFFLNQMDGWDSQESSDHSDFVHLQSKAAKNVESCAESTASVSFSENPSEDEEEDDYDDQDDIDDEKETEEDGLYFASKSNKRPIPTRLGKKTKQDDLFPENVKIPPKYKKSQGGTRSRQSGLLLSGNDDSDENLEDDSLPLEKHDTQAPALPVGNPLKALPDTATGTRSSSKPVKGW
jgi:hypothetical protein